MTGDFLRKQIEELKAGLWDGEYALALLEKAAKELDNYEALLLELSTQSNED